MFRTTGYAASTNHMTLADLALLSSCTTFAAMGLVDISHYPELSAWLLKMKKEVPNYEKANGEGAIAFGNFFKSKLAEC